MIDNRAIVAGAIRRALTGTGAHVENTDILDGLDWKDSSERPAGAPHSVFQLVNHMIYWQEWVVRWLDGKKAPLPSHAAGSWPGDARPRTRQEWNRTVQRFRKGLDALDRRVEPVELFSKRGDKTRLEMLHTIASHNSYHAGQIVALRQMLGRWPPPAGGLTW